MKTFSLPNFHNVANMFLVVRIYKAATQFGESLGNGHKYRLL